MKTTLLSTLCILYAACCLCQGGTPDPGFGVRGIVRTGFDSVYPYNSSARQVLLAADGSIYLLLFSNNTFISRSHPNGTIDSSFGVNGYARCGLFSEASAALREDGKIVVAGTNGIDENALSRLNANGSPDTSFGKGGQQPISFTPRSVALQKDGRIVVTGGAINGGFTVARYTTNGAPDRSFGGTGTVTTYFVYRIPPDRQGEDTMVVSVGTANSVAVQADGKIVVAGSSFTEEFGNNFAVARYNADGSTDSSFDTDGKQTTTIGASNAVAYSLLVQPDGKIILAGYTSDGSDRYDFAVVRYTTNGRLDDSFNGNGKQIATVGSDLLVPNNAALQADGKILVAGYGWDGAANDFAVARFNANGSPDYTFDGDGIKKTDIASSDDYAIAVAVQTDNHILVAGYAMTETGSSSVLARFNSNGSLDNTFDRDGKLVGDFRQGYSYFNAIAIQADGKLVAAGIAWNGSDYDFAVARYNRNGSLDGTFNKTGKQTISLGSADEATSVAIQSDGKIVLAGTSDNQFAVARFNADGSPDKTFSADAKLKVAIGYADLGQSLALQADGKIIVAGFSFPDENYDAAKFATVRINNDGSLDPSFSMDGKVLADFQASQSFGNSVAVQSNGKILVSGRAYIDGRNNFSIARFNPDGSLDTSFSHDGKQNTVFGQDNYTATSMALQPDGKILLAGYSDNFDGSSSSFSIARYLSNGELDNSFSGDGYQSTSLGPHFNFGISVAVNQDGRIAVAGTNDNFAVVLFKSNGAVDSSFGKSGILVSNTGLSTSAIKGIRFFENKLYAGGQAQYPGNFGVVARYLLSGGEAAAYSFVTNADGDWKLPGTWVGGVVPGEGASVVIRHKVLISGNISCYSLRVESATARISVLTGAHLTITH